MIDPCNVYPPQCVITIVHPSSRVQHHHNCKLNEMERRGGKGCPLKRMAAGFCWRKGMFTSTSNCHCFSSIILTILQHHVYRVFFWRSQDFGIDEGYKAVPSKGWRWDFVEEGVCSLPPQSSHWLLIILTIIQHHVHRIFFLLLTGF